MKKLLLTLTLICAAGVFYIAIRNISAGPLSEAVIINFAIIKGAAS